MKKSTAIICLTLLLSLYDAAATSFSLKEGSASCSGEFTLTDFSYDCGGGDDDECTPGGSVDISGEIYSSNGFTQDSYVYVKACFMMDMICMTLAESDMDVCSILDDDDDDDGSSECPEAGSYTFGSSYKIPGNVENDYWYGYSSTIHAIFMADSSTSTDCKVTVQAKQSSGSYAMITGAIAAVALAAAYANRKRRRRTIALNNEPLTAATTTTVEMSKVATEGAVV